MFKFIMVVTPLFGIDSIIYCNMLFVECCRYIFWQKWREYVDFKGKGFYNIIIRTQHRITTNYPTFNFAITICYCEKI